MALCAHSTGVSLSCNSPNPLVLFGRVQISKALKPGFTDRNESQDEPARENALNLSCAHEKSRLGGRLRGNRSRADATEQVYTRARPAGRRVKSPGGHNRLGAAPARSAPACWSSVFARTGVPYPRAGRRRHQHQKTDGHHCKRNAKVVKFGSQNMVFWFQL